MGYILCDQSSGVDLTAMSFDLISATNEGPKFEYITLFD